MKKREVKYHSKKALDKKRAYQILYNIACEQLNKLFSKKVPNNY